MELDNGKRTLNLCRYQNVLSTTVSYQHQITFLFISNIAVFIFSSCYSLVLMVLYVTGKTVIFSDHLAFIFRIKESMKHIQGGRNYVASNIA